MSAPSPALAQPMFPIQLPSNRLGPAPATRSSRAPERNRGRKPSHLPPSSAACNAVQCNQSNGALAPTSGGELSARAHLQPSRAQAAGVSILWPPIRWLSETLAQAGQPCAAGEEVPTRTKCLQLCLQTILARTERPCVVPAPPPRGTCLSTDSCPVSPEWHLAHLQKSPLSLRPPTLICLPIRRMA